ncbi:hypothetical protein [Streptomyces puniciscabiei]|uniref:hypothetical protein n=1 Tax=Streptomyces puniciscabiei TaxID=164348 RepID=UPI0006EBD5DA|nr:hypothetical protein [Streptomyces puniciscabiei]
MGAPNVVAPALASPTVDPVARTLPRLLLRRRLDSRREPSGLSESHRPEWKRAGLRRMVHTARVHVADDLEEAVARLRMPLLVNPRPGRPDQHPRVGPVARHPGAGQHVSPGTGGAHPPLAGPRCLVAAGAGAGRKSPVNPARAWYSARVSSR